MGEFVSNIYEGTRRNNDMYIIWASREHEVTAAFVNARLGGLRQILLLLYFLDHFNILHKYL